MLIRMCSVCAGQGLEGFGVGLGSGVKGRAGMFSFAMFARGSGIGRATQIVSVEPAPEVGLPVGGIEEPSPPRRLPWSGLGVPAGLA
jgi:hypothetical protein